MKRIERGWAGHFCCGTDCNWRRNTLIDDENGRWIVVSSVGALQVKNELGYREGFSPIGAGRYYETMVFIGRKDGIFIEADVTKQRWIKGLDWCVTREPDGKTDLEAEEIHENHVRYVMENFDNVYKEADDGND